MPVTSEELLQSFSERFSDKAQLDDALDRLILQDRRRLLEAALSAKLAEQAGSNQQYEIEKQALQAQINAIVAQIEANAAAAVAGGG